MMDEILQQILSELKEIKTSQALAEREIRKNRETLINAEIARITTDSDRAVLEQSVNRIKEDVSELKDRTLRMELIQENVTNPRLELILEHVGSINEKINAFGSVADKVEDHDTRIFALEQIVRGR